MDKGIRIIEKPDWVTWDEIHDVVWAAHEENRRAGIRMKFPSLPGAEIEQRIGERGKMLVAVDGKAVVGTAAVVFKNQNLWCGEGVYAYCCFGSVLPSARGTGIYRKMCLEREKIASASGVNRMLFDTNLRNKREIDISKKNGYHKVGLRYWGDHFNVVCVKWLDECPYTSARLNIEYLKRCIATLVKALLHRR